MGVEGHEEINTQYLESYGSGMHRLLGKYREQNITALWGMAAEGRLCREINNSEIRWCLSWEFTKDEDKEGSYRKRPFSQKKPYATKQEGKTKWHFGGSAKKVSVVWVKKALEEMTATTRFRDYVGSSPDGCCKVSQGFWIPLKTRGNHRKVLLEKFYFHICI